MLTNAAAPACVLVADGSGDLANDSRHLPPLDRRRAPRGMRAGTATRGRAALSRFTNFAGGDRAAPAPGRVWRSASDP
jgi:hypothetical protein